MRTLASTVGKDLLALHGHVEQMEGGEAGMEDLLRVHGADHVESVRAACEEARDEETIVSLDADTRVSGASWEAAVGSAGCVITAAEAVAQGRLRTAFVAARPPGHHATRDRAMGFCLFNHVAVAARRLQSRGHAERVLIVDWDVHHGNGTQDIFYDDPSVFYLSLHQWPHYPGTGAADETGVGAGEGFTLNVPLPAGTSRPVYLERFEAALDAAVRRASPDFILISAGFDVLSGDPLGGMLLEPEDLHAMTGTVLAAAAEACRGRVVASLEGGYDPRRLGAGVVAVVRALAGLPLPG